MFDLNLDISSRYQNNIQQVESSSALAAATQTTPDRVQLSGTSTSSVVNTADDRDSNHSSSALNFDVFAKLRTTDVDEEEEGEEVAGGMTSFAGGYLWQHRRPEYATRQLFPVDGDGSGGGGGFGVSCEGSGLTQAAESQWLKLSVSGSGGGVTDEMRILQQKQQQVRRSRRGPRSRSSQYRGVTFYRRTGRWESHIWDCGKQVYLGGFDTAHAAARAYDRAAIKFRGVDADINFTVTDYDEDMKQMKNLTKEEFVHVLRRQSTGFARGSSRFRGVNNSQRCGRWETWMGQYLGKKAYDQAALQYGFGEAPPFHPSNYGMKVPSEASNGGIGDNLDLTLGMSAPVGAHNANNNAGDLYYQNTFYQAADGKRPVMGNACYHPGVQALHGQPLPSRPPPAPIPGAFAGASTTHERSSVNHERKVGASALFSTRHSGWAWNGQMPPPAQGMVVGAGSSSLSVPIPLFSNDTSGAASSGFSSSNLQFHHFS